MPLTGSLHNNIACSYATPALLKFGQVRINNVFDLRSCRQSFKHNLGRRLHDFVPIKRNIVCLGGGRVIDTNQGGRSSPVRVRLRPPRKIYILLSLISAPSSSSITLSCIVSMRAPMLVALASHCSRTFTQTSAHALPKLALSSIS